MMRKRLDTISAKCLRSGFKLFLILVVLPLFSYCTNPQENLNIAIESGDIWPDSDGNHINAHAGGILYKDNVYYWFGESRPDSRKGEYQVRGVSCYSSTDLVNWKNEGLVLPVSSDPLSDIADGCIIERPKVIYNEKSSKFVMWFHLELKGKGYSSARTGVAVSDNVTGPYTFVRSENPNANKWPLVFSDEAKQYNYPDTFTWWTSEFNENVSRGMFVKRGFEQGQMSRDMTLFVDDDGQAYHIHSSEENLTLHISRLSDDYQSFSGDWIRIFPGGHNEAPAMFKRNGRYYLITSGCTGWESNRARVAVADSVMGEWTYLGNPCVGDKADKTFFSQSTFVLELERDKKYIFMADRWRPDNLIDSRYIWLPIEFNNEVPQIKWVDNWHPSINK